jgi:integrase/recombinase XerD
MVSMADNSGQNPSEYVEAWLVDLATTASKSTVSAYRQDIETYDRWLQDCGLSILSVVTEDLQTFVRELRETGGSVASCNRAASAVKAFYLYLVETGTSRRNPARNLQRLAVIEKVSAILTPEQMIRVLDAAHERARSSTASRHTRAHLARSAAMLETAYSGGFDVSELISMPVSTLSDRLLWRVPGADGVFRDRIVNNTARFAILEWRALAAECGNPSDKWLFHATRDNSKPISRQQVFRDFDEAGKASGIAMPFTLSPSIVRNSCGVHLLQNGMSVSDCAHLLGYRELGSLERLLVHVHIDRGIEG